MSIVVQKFGGTSVATAEARNHLLKHVKSCKNEGHKIVIVVSAMGRRGEPYATDTILSLLEEIDPNIDPMKRDMLLSCGEIISSVLISHMLDINGFPSVSLTGFQARILTNNDFSNSEIIDIDTTIIEKYLNEDKTVVIAGFQGMTWDGKITTLGRGGSDTSAVEIGGYLKADRVDIFTDVGGVAAVDPRIISSIGYLESISYSEMYKLASNGAKVIHPRAVKAAEKHSIPVRVRSTFSKDLGTLISKAPYDSSKKIIGIPLNKDFQYLKVNKSDSINEDFIKNNSLLYRDKNEFWDIYLDKNRSADLFKQKDSIYEHTNKIAKITILFHSKDREYIENQLTNFITMDTLDILDIFWFDDNASILLDNNIANDYIQKIYTLFYR